MKATLPKNKQPEKLIKSNNLFPVIGVGASAGGLDAFKKLLKAIPVDSGMAYVLVQHLDPNHESMLSEILQKVTPIPVIEIADDIKVEPNHIYVIPSNKTMVATDGVLLLAPRPEKSKTERYLPIDLFFTSLAIVHQTHAIGIILSGTGSDGTLGLKAIKDNGGITFVQDEASAAYPDMPNSAVQAEVVDFILSPDKMPEKLQEVTQIINKPTSVEENLPLGDEEAFRQINAVLRIRKGTDFTYYKQTTIRRRILRRMAINKNTAPAEYLNYLRENKPEQDLLYQDLLIPVTSFFRDHKVFNNLCANVFPLIIKNKQPGEPIRVWIAGCSTGEEAYSMAICIKEFLGSNSFDSEERVQIFATDLSERAILKARTGIYTKLDVAGLAQERLNNFFTKTNGSYQVNRQIRDLCVFATHNFLKDPPFGKMDLVSCRNVLIYMEPYLQKKALTTFHYALNQKGFLLLGKSETTSGVPDLFAATEKNDKLYTRKDAPSQFIHTVSPRTESNLIDTKDKPKTESMRSDFQKTADDIMLSKYSPAGVVINEAMDIVQFRGSTSRYLEQSSGKPSHNLLVLAKNGLAFELRNIIHKTKKATAAVIKENVPVEINGSIVNITIEAIPLPNTIEPHYLILFHDSNSIANKQEESENKKPTRKTKTDDKDLRIKQLELELTQAREDMRSITEDQEAANEELQSANEELLSGSEELQSLNEELETSKEELQSTNEELMVVNHEMIGLNEQIAAARNYAESIVANIREPLLVLDKNLRVKTANKSFYKTFKVNEKETEGTLIYDLGDKQWDIPELRNLLEKILPEKSIFTDFEVNVSFPDIGDRIMLLNAREVINKNTSEKLILLSVEDITKQRLFQLKEKKILSHYHDLLLQTPIAIAIYRGSNYIAELVNDLALEILAKDKNIIGKPLFESMPEMESQLKSDFDEVMKSGIPFRANEYEVTLIRNGKNEQTYFNTIFEPIQEDDNTISGVIVVAHEVTEQVLARKKIQESEERFQAAVDAVEGILWTNNAKGEMDGEQLGWSSLTGQNYEAYQEYGWADAIHSDDVQPTLDAWQEAVRDRKNFVFEHRVKYKNGNWGHFSVKAIPLLNADESIREWVGVHTDISERKLSENKLKESEKQFRLMAELIPQKVWTSDAKGNKDYFNKTLLDYVGKSFEELKGDGWEKIIHPDDREKNKKQWQECLKTGNDLETENRLLRKDGKYLWHLTTAVALKDDKGKIKMWIGSKTEIQEQREQKESLEKAVMKRTTELQKANEKLIFESSEKEKRAEELVKINKELEAFTYISSHDLQEPLRKIQTFANRIIEKENLSDSGKNYFRLMEDAAKRMRTLIDDLLSFSRLNTSERKFEIANLNTIINTVTADFKEIIDDKKAIIEITEICEAKIIAFQFRQLMQNLIGNALKFSKPNIPPHIIITSHIIKGIKLKHKNLSPEKNYCHISVSDNGIGFEEEYNKKVFEVFQRLHGKEEYAGTGIGLAIVKKIVENHDGEITVKSKLNKGTTFDIYLPTD
ncbi:MAG: PAS domain-containing protein [Flavobacterium sp.]|nr:PAS domain-containing protein [Flavobacterium sp.]